MQRLEAAWLGRFDSERRLNLHHMNLLKYGRENGLDRPLGVPYISGLLGKLHYKRGTENLSKNFFLFLQLKPKLVLRSRGV